MDGRPEGRTVGRMDRRTDGRTEGRTEGRTDGRKDGRPDAWTRLEHIHPLIFIHTHTHGPSEVKHADIGMNSDIKDEGYWCKFGRGIGGYWRVLVGIGRHVQTRRAEPLLNSPRKRESTETRISLRGVLERHLRSYYNTNKRWEVWRARQLEAPF